MRRETATVEDPGIYWALLDTLSSRELREYSTEKAYYERVSKILQDKFLSDPVTRGSFELGLSLHVAAPKIEAYYQFYEKNVVPSLAAYDPQCENWVYWHGKQICSPTDLDVLLSSSRGNAR